MENDYNKGVNEQNIRDFSSHAEAYRGAATSHTA